MNTNNTNIKIANTNIDEEKPISKGLCDIKGVGVTTATKILKDLSIDGNKPGKKVSLDEQFLIQKHIENNYPHIAEGVDKTVLKNIEHKKNIGCYAGYRLMNGYPCRGQSTKRNGSTAKKLGQSNKTKVVIDTKIKKKKDIKKKVKA